MALGFEVARRIPPALPRATASIAQLVILIVLTGLLVGAIGIALIGGAYMAILSIAH
jgi:hypothetical protein